MPPQLFPRYRRTVAHLWQDGVGVALLALALLVSVLLPGLARADTAPPVGAPTHITAALVAEKPARPGETILLALDMHPGAGWHGYWLNPGDAGLGMTLAWQLPAGARAGDPQYPVPEPLMVSGLMNHVYQDAYAVLVPFTVPANASGTLPVKVRADWLACSATICVPEGADLATTVTVGTGSADPRFAAWRARLPAPLGAQAQVALAGDTLRVAIPFPASAKVDHPHLFLADDRVADYAAPQTFARKGDLLLVTLKRAHGASGPAGTFHAVLRLDPAGDGVSLTAAPGPVPAGGTPLADDSAGAAAPALASLPLLIGAALLGGLLLNIMPCVFPILSLKALSLARAGESETEARVEGLAYTAGVVVACAILGALLLALRAGGAEVGWAFQLQEPGVVAALLALAVAITANLLGVFELAVPGFATKGTHGGASAIRSAFATGLLAAFVATPCTGPFMASAMGAALLLPPLPAMVLFMALGLGMALPFLAIAFVPALRRAMPRPGRWMNVFRKVLAVPMGLTALGLVWLASRLAGNGFALAAAGAVAVMLLVLLAMGRAQRKGLAVGWPRIGALAALAVVAILALPPLERAPDAEAAGVLPSQPFSEQALADARAQGKPVFAYFTADWCLTCKVNERVAIERADTAAAFKKAGVVVLKGDWTRRDPAITAYLQQRGAAGVPFYVWYPAKGAPPQGLPQVLTPALLAGLAAGNPA